jgi:NDP-sugar pyrophosphorylase family protein
MVENKVQQIPVVDGDRRVVGLHTWDEVFSPSKHDTIVFLMAGGRGSRLRPLTDNCPKPLLNVAGKPILEHTILSAREQGFCRFVVSVGYLGHLIEEHFGAGERLGVDIRYLYEEEPLGTAGSLALLSPTPEVDFIVSNGDVLTDARFGDMLEFHKRCDAAATMAVRVYEWQNPFGVVQTNGVEIIGFEEKPVHRSHVNAGVYILSPVLLELLRKGSSYDMPMLFELAKANGLKTVAYPMHEPWLDVGRPEDLENADAHVTKLRAPGGVGG